MTRRYGTIFQNKMHLFTRLERAMHFCSRNRAKNAGHNEKKQKQINNTE
jgi:hypothetical protein